MDSGTRLNARVEGSGTPVVLLHPIGLDMTCWDPVASRLSAEFTVVRADMRGHGLSPRALASARIKDYADDVHRLLSALALGPCAMVGLSFGGMIAQTLALTHPADVSALVLAGCTATLPRATRETIRERGRAALQNGMESVVEETLQRWFSPDFIASGAADAVRSRLQSNDVEGWAAGWVAISGHDAQERLATIAVPTLCIAGEADAAAPPAVMQTMAAAIPNGRLVELPGAPHMMHIACPDMFADTVANFLRAEVAV